MTNEEESSPLGLTPTPRRILNRLTLHVSLEQNGKCIFTRRLQPSSERHALDLLTQSVSKDLEEMVTPAWLRPAPSANSQSKKPE